MRSNGRYGGGEREKRGGLGKMCVRACAHLGALVGKRVVVGATVGQILCFVVASRSLVYQCLKRLSVLLNGVIL